MALGFRRRTLHAAVPRNSFARRASRSFVFRRQPPMPAADSAPSSIERLGLGGRRRDPGQPWRPRWLAACRRAVQETVLGVGRRGRKSVPGRRACSSTPCWSSSWNAAGAGRTCSCRPRPEMRAPRWARYSTSGIRCAQLATDQRRFAAARPQLQRGRNQAGAGELQAALSLPALDR